VEENTVRKDTYELPLASVREAICNAAFHRNYLEPSNVYVALYDDRLEIVSPGRLLKEISIEEVRLGYSKIRNKGLADALVYMHEVESWGGGVARYYSAIMEAGLPAPVTEERNGFFTVIFWRPKKDDADNAKNEGVNEGVNRLLNIVIANSGKRTNDLAFLMGKSLRTDGTDFARWSSLIITGVLGMRSPTR
jgi:predicted HTH transcriptional regulator